MALVIGVPTTVGAVSSGSDRLALAAVFAAVTFGVLAAAAWLLVSVAADTIAGIRPTRRRLVWGLALTAAGFVGPVFVLAALAAGA